MELYGMSSWSAIWFLPAGMVFFMLAMRFMEESLQMLVGRPFKLFLQKLTRRRGYALLGGALFTILLQSSSLFNVLVLGMTGAGLFQLSQALALMLGSNLGTTATGWLLVIFGFEFNLSTFFLALTGMSGLLFVFTAKEHRLHPWVKFIFSFSFLFYALFIIRTGMENLVEQNWFAQLIQWPSFIKLLAGVVITALVQSSSTTMALTLSALYAGGIDLYSAMAILLGAEIGTILKLIPASAGGSAVKKQVAMGNLLMNITVSLLAFLLLPSLYHLLTESLQIRHPLFALVSFQTLVNLMGILIFLPVLPRFARWLSGKFTERQTLGTHISQIPAEAGAIAVQALEREVQDFSKRTLQWMSDCVNGPALFAHSEIRNASIPEGNPEKSYNHIKEIHGKMLSYSLRVQTQTFTKKEQVHIQQLIAAMRNLMYAAKSMHDALPDIDQMRNSSNEDKFRFYEACRILITHFCRDASPVLTSDPGTVSAQTLLGLYKSVSSGYDLQVQNLYEVYAGGRLPYQSMSTLLNLNRELYSAMKSMVLGIKEWHLSETEADVFDTLPGFIH